MRLRAVGWRQGIITLEATAGELVLRVRDVAEASTGGNPSRVIWGLHSMRERAASVGGVILEGIPAGYHLKEEQGSILTVS